MDDWTREHAGYYTRSDGAVITLIRGRWELSHPYRNEDSKHRTLRDAKLAAERI